jgi:hypothetical protein
MTGMMKSIEKAEKTQEAPASGSARQSTPLLAQNAFGLTDIQQAAGNLAVMQLLRTGVAQGKLTVNQPGDIHEQEADKVAERVVSSDATNIAQKQCTCGGQIGAGGECPQCNAGNLPVQRKAISAGAPAAASTVLPDILRFGAGRSLDASSRGLMESHLGFGFGDVRVHTGEEAAESAKAINARAYTIGRDVVFGKGEYEPATSDGKRLLAHELTHVVQQNQAGEPAGIQRQAADAAPSATAATPGPTSPTSAPDAGKDAKAAGDRPTGLIIDDSAQDIEPNQMKRGDFLSQLRAAVNSAAEDALSASTFATLMRPQVSAEIERQFGLYSGLNAQSLENTIRQQVPGAAGVTAASGFIPLICEQVRQSVTANLPKREDLTGEAMNAADAAMSAVGSLAEGVGSAVSSAASIFFKAREGGAHASDDPRAIRHQLGAGSGLDAGVHTSMESAFGRGFSDVRVHADAKAGQLADRFNARAFTIGRDIAFGTGEYQPGTLVGDALIAHELAHVAQQRGASNGAVMTDAASNEGAFEEDADAAAVRAVVALWSSTRDGISFIQQNAVPALRSGLRLRRCGKDEPVPGIPEITKPVTPPPEEPLYVQFNRQGAQAYQNAINKVVTELNLDMSKIEDGQMTYVGTVGEGGGQTYPVGDRDIRDERKRLGKKPQTKPVVRIYLEAFGDGWPLLKSSIRHEWQHVRQFTPGQEAIIKSSDESASEVEAYCEEILYAEKQELHLQKQIKLKKSQKEINQSELETEEKYYKTQTGPEYIIDTLWLRVRVKWKKSGKPASLKPLCEEARLAVTRMAGGRPVPGLDDP